MEEENRIAFCFKNSNGNNIKSEEYGEHDSDKFISRLCERNIESDKVRAIVT